MKFALLVLAAFVGCVVADAPPSSTVLEAVKNFAPASSMANNVINAFSDTIARATKLGGEMAANTLEKVDGYRQALTKGLLERLTAGEAAITALISTLAEKEKVLAEKMLNIAKTVRDTVQNYEISEDKLSVVRKVWPTVDDFVKSVKGSASATAESAYNGLSEVVEKVTPMLDAEAKNIAGELQKAIEEARDYLTAADHATGEQVQVLRQQAEEAQNRLEGLVNNIGSSLKN